MLPTEIFTRSITIATSRVALALCALVLVSRDAHAQHSPPDARQDAPAHREPNVVDEVEGAVVAPSVDAERTTLPDPSSGREISLDEALAYADANSPVVSVARSTRSLAEATRVAASVLLPTNPELSAALGPRFGLSGTGVDADVSLMQQIQVAGERRARMRAADRNAELTEAEIDQMRWAIHCDVHAAFHRALIERERARLAERVVAFQEDVLRVVRSQIAVGETAPLTLRLAEAEVAQARQVLVAANQDYLAARIRLGLLAGWPASTPPTPAGDAEAPREPPDLDALIAIAEETLPSIRTAQARIQLAEARVTVANREAAPRPSVGVQYRREGNPTAEGHYDIVLGALSIPIPLFQRNQGARAQARAEVIVAEAELDATRRLLAGQIAEARSQVSAAAQRALSYQTEIVPRFEENLTLLRRSFELGEIDILALSTGRERFLRMQSDALLSRVDYFVSVAGLERAVGAELWPDRHSGEPNP